MISSNSLSFRSAIRLATSVSAALIFISASSTAQVPHPLTAPEAHKIESIIHQMTLEQKLDYIGGTGFAIRAVPSVSLPALEMSDGPYGTRSNTGFPSTTYSAGIGLAATWDRDLAARVGAGIGRDARARGVHFMLGPGVNIYRSPRNGRNFEYFGEDPFLAANIASGYITGMQQQGVSATIKHFLGNSSEFLRHDSDSAIDERTLREIYLPTFEAAVRKAHVGSIMDSYNLINGAHATQNGYFNSDLVRKQWGFSGIMMSDWSATYDAVAAANGGLDLEMPTGRFMNRINLEPAIRSGAVSEATLDEKIRHILSTAASFGWLDHAQTDPSISFVDSRNTATALDSARESAVLLKNEGSILPLDKAHIRSILVVGPDAYPGVPVGGGSAGVVPFHTVSALEGITGALGQNATVFYERGLPTISQLARETSFSTAPAGGKPGLTLQTFHNDDLSGTPATTSIVQHINSPGVSRESIADEPEAAAAVLASAVKHASRRFTGYYTAPSAGTYIVALEGAGESSSNRVYLDGELIIDNWKLVRALQPSITAPLSAGPHKVVVEDSQNGPLFRRLHLGIVAQDQVVTPRARELAAKADAVVVAVGFQQDSETEGGDRTFALPFGQDQLINAITAANRKTIVTVTAGGNVDSSAWIDRVPALLQTWYAGQEGGRALAEILFGEISPSGHLPVTLERRAEDNPTFNTYYPEGQSQRVVYKEGIFVGYRGYEHNKVQPLFPFGYGLSYTTFKFDNISVARASSVTAFPVAVSFDLSNSGTRKGAEVAQVYVTEVHSKVPRPEHELKGFERVELSPGETRHVTIPLDARAFAFYDTGARKWTINPGKFTIRVGDSVQSLPLSATIDLSGDVAAAAF